MVRLAIVGIGGYGWNLVQTIKEVSQDVGCRLVGAADTRLSAFPERVRELCDDGAELFDDALRMFEALRGKCEAVYIATGIDSHTPLTVAAAEAAVGLAIIITIYRSRRTVDVEQVDLLQG